MLTVLDQEIAGQTLPIAHCARVLFVGETWFGSCARACSAAMRRLGHDVLDIDTQIFFPQWKSPEMRVVRRLLASRIVVDFNSQVIDAALSFKPDLLIAFKGMYLSAKTLARLRQTGVRLYNYFPDRMVVARGTDLESTLPEYDCVFDTKRFWDGDMGQRLRLRDRVFLPHGYDPELHRPAVLSDRDHEVFGCDVSFIGTYTARKERILDELVKTASCSSLNIFGNGWSRCRSWRLRPFIRGAALCGQSYPKAIAASRINLALMGVSDDVLDETSTRTYEIPACKGFMLHERSEEVCNLYTEGREIACFSSAQELADQIAHYLAHSEERARTAEAGFRRAVPGYSYENRVKTIFDYHFAN